MLQSALACFAEQGYQATTIDEIVRRAGVSKGMIYNYFPSKEEIYLQLLQEQTDDSFQELEDVFATVMSAQDKLRILMGKFREVPLSVDRQRAIAVHLEFMLYCSRHEDLKQVMLDRYQRFIGFLTRILEDGQTSGEFPSTLDTQAYASVFWALRDGICLHFTHVSSASEYERVCDMAEQVLFHYLRHPHA